MKKGRKELLVVGDRILVETMGDEHRTHMGLLLPPGAVEKEDVQGGIVVATGPGTPLPPPEVQEEPWKTAPGTLPRYLPMQIEVGDFALFFRKAAIEITFEDQKYLVVPQQAVLVLVREPKVPDTLPEDL